MRETTKTFIGKDCKKGHGGERYVAGRRCVACQKEALAAYYIKNKESIIQKTTNWQKNNESKEKRAARNKKWHKDNPDKVKERSKQNYWKHAEKRKQSAREYRKKPSVRARIYQAVAERKALKMRARPAWLTDEEVSFMIGMYEIRKRITECTGISYHVDHIVPLKGKTVCGLHVPWNLQLLPARKNIQKRNKLEDNP